MNILALDLGTTTGWACCHSGGLFTTGSQSFKPTGRFEGGGMRYLKFSNWLSDLYINTPNGIEHVVFEEVRRHMGVDAAHAYGGFLAHLTAWCEKHEIPYQGVPVGTNKKFATGKGNADKAQMILAARKRGFDPVDDNEADAISLLHYALEHFDNMPTHSAKGRKLPASKPRVRISDAAALAWRGR